MFPTIVAGRVAPTLEVAQYTFPDTYHYVTNKERTELRRRLRSSSTKDPSTGCWVWQKSQRKKNGYGKASYKGKAVQAHRLSYIAYKADIQDGMVVHHTCGNNLCINPRHLQSVSHHDNVAEMLQRKEYVRRIAELEAEVERLRSGECACDRVGAPLTIG